MPGSNTLDIDVTHISKNGFWILFNQEELLISFEYFPWFKKATIEQISTVERPTENHLYWPLLDVDLALQSIRDPSAFPLLAK